MNEFVGSTGRSTVLWGGLFNVSTLVGQRSRIALNNTYTRTADNEARYDVGFDYFSDLEIQRTQLRFVDRSIRSNQLLGEHQFGDAQRLDWSITASGVTRSEPDRADVAYGRERGAEANVPFRFLSSAGRLARSRTSPRMGTASRRTNSSGSAPVRSRTDSSCARSGRRRAMRRILRTALRPLAPESKTGCCHRRDLRWAVSGPGDAYFGIQPLLAGGSYTADDQVARVRNDRVRVLSRVRVIAELASSDRISA